MYGFIHQQKYLYLFSFNSFYHLIKAIKTLLWGNIKAKEKYLRIYRKTYQQLVILQMILNDDSKTTESGVSSRVTLMSPYPGA